MVISKEGPNIKIKQQELDVIKEEIIQKMFAIIIW